MFRNFVDRSKKLILCSAVMFVCLLAFTVPSAWAQTDQGAITGVVQDDQGAVIPGAKVTLTATDTSFVLERTANSDGVFVFAPVKIGNYKLSAGAPSFQTTVRENLHLDIQQRMNVTLALKPGAVTEQVTVSTESPLLETQTSTVGQVISSETINNTPLNGRNWVYIAQLTAGVAPPFGNTRGSGTGDFVANGQSAEQNDFLLDGVDNNTNLIDFLNGSSYVVRPPPDALAEFSLQTSNFSAEFGHSAGAVLSASIKSGTNQIHGDVWEYVRNTSLNARPWNSASNTPYHENQFGATLGLPIWKNHFFYFGDVEANRISLASPSTGNTVPTALMRQGNFSELLNTALTSNGAATQLYQPNSGGTQTLSCNGVSNVFCPGQIDAVAQNILKLYPNPNAGVTGQTYNNYITNLVNTDNTVQFDQRLDWNISQKDQVYARYSYSHEIKTNGLILGPILDGSGFGGQHDTNLAENFILSETHAFAPTLTNEFRFGYNWIHSQFFQPNANSSTLAASLGLGGVPFPGPGLGGIPVGSVDGINRWGSVGTQDEGQNVYQILDNVSKAFGKHSLRIGVSFQSFRVFDRYAPAPIGQYFYNNTYTGKPGVGNTGFGVADFLANQMNSADIASSPPFNDVQWYNSAYFQDDWKVLHNLTLNLGLRYDHYQPYKENAGNQANFVQAGNLGISTGTGVYELPSRSRNTVLAPAFLAILAQDNIALQYNDNERLATGQNLNFAPRIGLSYQPTPKTVVRSGFGLFYGGLQSEGNSNLATNYPWSNSANLNVTTNCVANNCPSLASEGITLETGLVAKTGVGLQNFVANPGIHAIDANIKTPYTMNYNLSYEQQVSHDMVATVSYVGNVSRHLPLYFDPNTLRGLYAPGTSTQLLQPFPQFGGIGTIHYGGISDYNSLQAKLEKRMSKGLSFLATYTWSHNLTDDSDAGGLEGAVGDRNMALIPYTEEYTNSPYDVRHRFTLNGNYQLPFGRGKAFLNQSRWEDEIVGGWSSSLTFVAQTGTPFSVGTANISTASGGSARAIKIRDPFAPGGTPPDPTLVDQTTGKPLVTCATKTKTKANWYNPCAFANPLRGNLIAPSGTTVGTPGYQFYSPVTDEASAIALLGGRSNNIYGPGYYGLNMSLFKDFATFRKQYLSFRVDAFNLLNHPTLGNPSISDTSTNGGQIQGPKFFQQNTPDSRFLQLSAKYVF